MGRKGKMKGIFGIVLIALFASKMVVCKDSKVLSAINETIMSTVNEKSATLKRLEANKKDKFVQALYKNGISNFASSSVVELVQEIQEKDLNGYASYLASKLAIPKGVDRDEFIETIMMSVFTFNNEIKEFDFIYKKNKGSAKCVCVVIASDADKKTLTVL